MTAMRREPMPTDRPTVSALLRDLVETWPSERIALGDLVEVLGARGHGILMLALTLPNLVPLYLPGLSAVTGLPVAAVAAQMAAGRRHPWLPAFLNRRSVAKADFARLVERALPWVERVERLLRPRLHPLAGAPAERLAGAVCVILALLLSLPIPLTNMLLAVPILLYAIGIVARDGAAIAAATAATAGAIAFIATAGWAMTKGALAFIGV